MSIKIAINGFGRIGRQTANILLNEFPHLELVAINDLADSKTLGHLFKYDSVYGIYPGSVEIKEDCLVIDNKEIKVLAEKEPAQLPWKEMGIDLVIESTGVFRTYQAVSGHLKAGAKKVILSAPGKGEEKIPVFVPGVNENVYQPEKMDIVSMASCTTNCLAPILKILEEKLGIEKAFMTTVHSYTNDQKILDLAHKDLRRARATGLSIIPTTTGAVNAAAQTMPDLEGRIDGVALRVPTAIVSIVDLTAILKRKTSKEELNSYFQEAEKGDLKGILGTSKIPLVSIDYKKDSRSSIIDLDLTMVQDNLVKIFSWYDNEWGYSCRLAEFTNYIAQRL